MRCDASRHGFLQTKLRIHRLHIFFTVLLLAYPLCFVQHLCKNRVIRANKGNISYPPFYTLFCSVYLVISKFSTKSFHCLTLQILYCNLKNYIIIHSAKLPLFIEIYNFLQNFPFRKISTANKFFLFSNPFQNLVEVCN